MARLENKVALITGTGGGQGRAAALLFAQEGARVVGCDLKTEGAQETVEMVKAAGGEMVSMAPLDLTDEVQVKKWIDFAVATFGDFDILYNNASAPKFGSVETMSLEDWDFTLANELTLVFLAIKHSVPVFRRKGHGNIINVASLSGVAGSSPTPGGFAHAATKGGVIAMTNHLAGALAPLNVRVNVISPGGIKTPAIAAAVNDPRFQKQIAAQAIPRFGEPEDIAYAALYLASNESSFVTAANFVIDGGRRLGPIDHAITEFDSTAFNPGRRMKKKDPG